MHTLNIWWASENIAQMSQTGVKAMQSATEWNGRYKQY